MHTQKHKRCKCLEDILSILSNIYNFHCYFLHQNITETKAQICRIIYSAATNMQQINISLKYIF